MQKLTSALVLMILGLVILVFPLLGLITVEAITAIAVLLLGVGFISTGLTSMNDNSIKGIVEVVLGVLALVLGIGFIFNPFLFSFAAAIFVFMAGIFMILAGITGLVTKDDLWNSVVALVLGILYMFLAVFLTNPYYLGWIIGFWMLITGVMYLINEN